MITTILRVVNVILSFGIGMMLALVIRELRNGRRKNKR
jgi:site-specific recombinase